MDNMKEYKITVDFGKGPFVQYIVVKDFEEAQLHCSLIADVFPFLECSIEEVSI